MAEFEEGVGENSEGQKNKVIKISRSLFLFVLDLTLLIAAVPRGSKLTIRTVFLMFARTIIYSGVIMAQYGLYATLQVDRRVMEPNGLTMSVESILGLPENCNPGREKRDINGWEELIEELAQTEEMPEVEQKVGVDLEGREKTVKEKLSDVENELSFDFEDPTIDVNTTFADFEEPEDEQRDREQLVASPKGLSSEEQQVLKQDPLEAVYDTLNTKPNHKSRPSKEKKNSKEKSVETKPSKKERKQRKSKDKEPLGMFTETDVHALGLVFCVGVVLLCLTMMCSSITVASAQENRVALAKRDLKIMQARDLPDAEIQTSDL